MVDVWEIRKAVHEDTTGLTDCMVRAYESYCERLDGRRLPSMDVDYGDEIDGYPSWVAVKDGVVGGGLIMVFKENYASIANIAVHPDFQGQGLGGALMRFAETVARKEGYTEMRLATHVLLTENVSLYGHLGWNETGRDDMRVYMSKRLP